MKGNNFTCGALVLYALQHDLLNLPVEELVKELSEINFDDMFAYEVYGQAYEDICHGVTYGKYNKDILKYAPQMMK